MKYIALVVLVLLAGCIGTTSHNPMNRKDSEPIWWQASTADITTADNPWETYVRPNPLVVGDDPWDGHKAPSLFPKDWKPAKKYRELKRLRKQLRLLRLRKLLRWKRWKKKQRKRERLERLRKRSIIYRQRETC